MNSSESTIGFESTVFRKETKMLFVFFIGPPFLSKCVFVVVAENAIKIHGPPIYWPQVLIPETLVSGLCAKVGS